MLDRYQSEIQSKEIPEGIQDDREEMLNKCKSDLARSWGKYCLLLLQRSMDKDIADRSVITHILIFLMTDWSKDWGVFCVKAHLLKTFLNVFEREKTKS